MSQNKISRVTGSVAIKILKNNNNSFEFLKEASNVARLEHENIVGFFGVCLGMHIEFMIIFDSLMVQIKYYKGEHFL